MLKYALDYKTCRKLLFDSYFGNPANVVAPYAESDRTVCGHCDNCIRFKAPTTKDNKQAMNAGQDEAIISQKDSAANEYASKQQVITRNVTMEAWKICKIIKAADELSSRITLPGAGDLCRGLSKCTFPTKNKDAKASLNLDKVCNGKITSISKEDMEILLLELLLQGYLKEEFVQTAYTINSYIVTGPQSIRLTRLREEQVETSRIKIEFSTLTTVKASSKGKGKNKKNDEIVEEGEGDDVETEFNEDVERKKKSKPTRKRKSSEDLNGESASDSLANKGKSKKESNRKDANSTKKSTSGKKKGPEPLPEATEPQAPKKRRKKAVTDSDDEDWEDFGLPVSKANGKQTKQRVGQDSQDEDELGSDSHAMKPPSDVAGFDMSEEDIETGGEEDSTSEYPFVRDRFTKKRDSESAGSARSRAASAALTRAGVNSKDRHVIDLDSI